jgi:heme exporter protein A
VSSEDAVLRTDRLTKQFGHFTALHNLSIAIPRGTFLTIFGRNGAGKTTFLKIVSTLIRSFSGSVTLFAEDLKRADDTLRRRLGFVSHESFLYNDLTVVENLQFYARMYRLEKAPERVQTMVARVGLETKASTPARALSRGMKQRLALGRAFLHEPDLLLLDEPFTGLDETASDMLQSMLEAFKSRGGTVVMATHQLERGWKHADRIGVIERGALVYHAGVTETSYDAFREKYRGILTR